MRDFVDDRTKDRWLSLLRLYISGDLGQAADMPKCFASDEPRGTTLGQEDVD